LVHEVTVAGSDDRWRWADPQGVQRLVHVDELRSALATGALPPYTLVWQKGMAEWRPAYLVPDLAPTQATPDGGLNIPPPPLAIVAVQEEWERGGSGKPAEPEKEVEPPPPPVHQYAAIMAAVPAHVTQASEASRAAAPPVASKRSLHRPAGGAAKGAAMSPEPAPLASPAAPSSAVAAPSPAPPAVTPAAPPVVPGLPPGISPASALPALPVSRASGPPPPARQHHPAPVSLAPPAGLTPLIPPTQTRSASVPAGPTALKKTLLGIAGPSPIVVPAPQAFPPPGVSQSPPFAGNGHVDAAVVPPAPGVPEPSTLGLSHDAPASSQPGDLPAFPLDEIEIDEDEDHSPASRAARRGLPVDRGISARVVEGLREATRAIKPLAQRAKNGALRATEGLVTKAGPAVVDGFAYIKANPQDPKVMAGLGGTALLVLIGLGAIAMSAGPKKHSEADEPVGAGSVAASASAAPETQPTAAAPSTTAASAPSSSGACHASKEGVRIAAKASKDVPIELSVLPGGERARIGFSSDTITAQGLSIDLASFKMTPEYAARAYKLRAVIPASLQGKSTFLLNSDGKKDKLQAWRSASADPPMVVGWADNAISAATKPTDAPRALWTLDGDAVPDSVRTADLGEGGVAVVFRRRGGIFGGVVGKDRAPHGSITQVAGAGAPEGSPIGTPSLAVSGAFVAVAFADRASPSEPWGLRLGVAPVGSIPSQTIAFAVPAGGPGGAAIAPALAGLADGRFLLVWTEGSSGHDVRAQTLASDLHPLGGPFTVSPTGGNAGQGSAAVTDGRGLVAYLALTGHAYEVWATGVDCR
jgi:hypothetical protein